MANQNGVGSVFPSQAVSDSEKRSKEYGLAVARAIEAEWFRRDSGTSRFNRTRDDMHRLRLYARGEQSIEKYKSEFAINGDLSYLNLDWKPVPILSKFHDLLVNGMQDRVFDVKAFAQDPISTGRRTAFVEGIMEDMQSQEIIAQIDQQMGVDTSNVPQDQLPQSTEELELYMQIAYKEGIEIAVEEAINNIFMRNYYDDLKRRVNSDLVTLGIGCVKHEFNNTDGIHIQYVDPADLIYSYTEDPDFRDVYYFGEIRKTSINEVKKLFPTFDAEKLKEIQEAGGTWWDYNSNRYNELDQQDNNTLQLMHFSWKTFENNVYKVKETAAGTSKAIQKDDQFNPPKDQRSRFERVAVSREVIYEGVYVLGSNMLLRWQKQKNMTRPKSNENKVMMNYCVCAPRIYKGKIESLVQRMTTYADLIQLTHLKLQQVVQRMTPSGVMINADGLAEIDLGNGTSYNPQEALNMYFQTGSVIMRSMTSEGDPAGAIPIQELPGGGGQQIEQLIGTYNHYMQMLRDVTGVSEARDGSLPHEKTLVGVQKLAALNSNTATRHVLDASLIITEKLARGVVLRLQDVMEFHPQKELLMGSIGRFSVGSLEELNDMHIHDFGIFLELEPDDIEKDMLENNIQQALSTQSIELEDAIDIRMIKNVKLANQLLKFRRIRKRQADQEEAQANQQAQAQAQADAQMQVEQAKVQAQQQLTQSKIQEEEAKSQFRQQEVSSEAVHKKDLMQFEFDLNVKLKELELAYQTQIAKMQNTVNRDIAKLKSDSDIKKAEMTNAQRVMQGKTPTNEPKKSFESSGNDVLGGIDLSKFEPK